MLTRNLDKARDAFKHKSISQSKQAHGGQDTSNGQSIQDKLLQQSHGEDHNNSGSYIKSAVYGGLDGIITTYSVVMGVAGADLSTIVVLALGMANMIGDGVCMALGDYLSTKSEMQFQKKERMREEWEVENCPEEEKEELVEIYQNKGLSKEDAETVIGIFSKYKKTWVDIMMVEELGLLPCEENPIKNGLVTFASFVIFGLMPILPFIIVEIFSIHIDNALFYISTAMTAFFLFILGLTKSFFVFSKWWKSGLETLLIGVISAAAAYLIGLAFRPLMDKGSE